MKRLVDELPAGFERLLLKAGSEESASALARRRALKTSVHALEGAARAASAVASAPGAASSTPSAAAASAAPAATTVASAPGVAVAGAGAVKAGVGAAVAKWAILGAVSVGALAIPTAVVWTRSPPVAAGDAQSGATAGPMVSGSAASVNDEGSTAGDQSDSGEPQLVFPRTPAVLGTLAVSGARSASRASAVSGASSVSAPAEAAAPRLEAPPSEAPLVTAATPTSPGVPASAAEPVPPAPLEMPPLRAEPARSLLQEVHSLDLVRAALASREPKEALDRLDRYQKEFPAPALGPESSLLRIESLVELGDREAANAVAARLLAAHPEPSYRERAEWLLRRGSPR